MFISDNSWISFFFLSINSILLNLSLSKFSPIFELNYDLSNLFNYLMDYYPNLFPFFIFSNNSCNWINFWIWLTSEFKSLFSISLIYCLIFSIFVLYCNYFYASSNSFIMLCYVLFISFNPCNVGIVTQTMWKKLYNCVDSICEFDLISFVFGEIN